MPSQKIRKPRPPTELEKALEGGLTDSAIYFELGFLRSNLNQADNALAHLQTAVKHEDYALAARLLMAQIQRQAEHLPEAVGGIS